MKKKNILVISAHPDDEVLGCGGTIIKYSKKFNVFSIIAGEGITSRNQKRPKNIKSRLDILKKQALMAAKIMGVKKTFFLSLPDNKLDTLPLLEIIQKIESIILKIKPEIIYTHHHGDLNIDHRITHEAVLTAYRPIPGSSVKTIYAFETVSSTEWSSVAIGPVFHPTRFVDISANWQAKKRALQAYSIEMRPYPHARSMEALEALARVRGTNIGTNLAEAFEVVIDIVS